MNWNNPLNWAIPNQPILKAKPHCCEEASLMSGATYIPCNKPATQVVGWKGRSDAPIRMCEMCTHHNVNNRGGEIIRPYTETLTADQAMCAASWPTGNPEPSTPYDKMSNDELLVAWQNAKQAIEKAKAHEMELRKAVVKREFPKPDEGMNTKELGNGYQLKAGVKFNYKLADNDTVEDVLNRISALGNEGSFIASRLVSWTPNFLLTEYRQLQEDAEKGSSFAKQALDEVNKMLTITEAAPTLEVKEPKAKKK